MGCKPMTAFGKALFPPQLAAQPGASYNRRGWEGRATSSRTADTSLFLSAPKKWLRSSQGHLWLTQRQCAESRAGCQVLKLIF